MTVKSEYRCNLCGDEITATRTGVGVIFTSASFSETRIIFRMVSDAQTHLCRPCIKAVVAANVEVNDRPQDSLT